MEQIDRAQRYLDRMRRIYAGIFMTRDEQPFYEDDVVSFFMHCYHIRDWILHLNKVGITANHLDAFINGHDALRICADLCNGSKHCQLERKPRSGRQPHFAGKAYDTSTWLMGGGGGNVVRGRYTILTHAGTVDALDLAEQCMRLWTHFVARASDATLPPQSMHTSQ